MLLVTIETLDHMFSFLEHKVCIALNKMVDSISLCLFAKLQVAQVEVADGFKHTCAPPYCILLLSECTTLPQLQVTAPTLTTACFDIFPTCPLLSSP